MVFIGHWTFFQTTKNVSASHACIFHDTRLLEDTDHNIELSPRNADYWNMLETFYIAVITVGPSLSDYVIFVCMFMTMIKTCIRTLNGVGHSDLMKYMQLWFAH